MSLKLDSPSRMGDIRKRIQGKPALRKLYLEVYSKYRECLKRCPDSGIAIELGSGAGFVKEVLPEVVTTDVIPYPGLDQVVDATRMPYANNCLRAILMFDVFHHIPDAARFLAEAERCLKPGGRILIVDQHFGWISGPILKYAHHEPFDTQAKEWRFASSGPLSGANGALAWIIFQRDRERFEKEFPKLRLERYSPHTPLRYWLSGGLKNWSLLPGFAFGAATKLDRLLVRCSSQLGSFVDIELVKKPL